MVQALAGDVLANDDDYDGLRLLSFADHAVNVSG